MAPSSLFALSVAAATVVAWLLVLALLALRTRNPPVRPGPVTSELGPEPPAIVDLLTNGWRPTGTAVAATILDLAARDMLQIDEIGPELSLVRLRTRADTTSLARYERLVYDRIRRLARDGVVSTQALAEGERDVARWSRTFRNQVIAHTRRLGLSRRRWARGHLLGLFLASAVPAAGVAFAAWQLARPQDKWDDARGAAATVVVVLMALVGALNSERGTPAGAAAAGRWLGVRAHLAANPQFADCPAAGVTIWGRHLAYAAAFGFARLAVQSLPLGRRPDDREAWSDFGGMWHLVRVRYRKRWPLWGISPGRAVGRGLTAALPVAAITLVALVLASLFLDWQVDPLPLAFYVGVLVAAIPIAFAVFDPLSVRTVEGQIVRLRRLSTGEDKAICRLAVDTGRSRDVVAYGLRGNVFDQLVEGDQVKVRVGRVLGFAYRVDVVKPSRFRAADSIVAGSMGAGSMGADATAAGSMGAGSTVESRIAGEELGPGGARHPS